MIFEGTGGSELAELVSDHIFGHEHRHERFAVVDVERMSNEIRNDHGTTAPGLDGNLVRGIHFFDFVDKMLIDKRSFLDRSRHYFFLRSTMKFLDVFFGLRVRLPLAS